MSALTLFLWGLVILFLLVFVLPISLLIYMTKRGYEYNYDERTFLKNGHLWPGVKDERNGIPGPKLYQRFTLKIEDPTSGQSITKSGTWKYLDKDAHASTFMSLFTEAIAEGKEQGIIDPSKGIRVYTIDNDGPEVKI